MFGPMLKLSPRMHFVFDHLLPGEAVWDLCCDHGLIGLRAYQSGQFPQIHFVDQVPLIVQNLEKKFLEDFHLAEAGQKAFFCIKEGGQLEVVDGTVIIAGVGAHAILKILRSLSQKKGLSAIRLILGPQRDEAFFEDELATWLEFKNNFKLLLKAEIIEGIRVRRIFIFDKIN